MGTHTRTLERKCSCGTNLIEVHMKNPFIDDFSDECPKCEPGAAFQRLTAWATSAAKAEQDDERESYNQEEE